MSSFFFFAERAIQLVESGIAGKVSGKQINAIGTAPNAKDDATGAKHERAMDPLIKHKISKIPRIFLPLDDDPERIPRAGGQDGRDSPIFVVCGVRN